MTADMQICPKNMFGMEQSKNVLKHAVMLTTSPVQRCMVYKNMRLAVFAQ